MADMASTIRQLPNSLQPNSIQCGTIACATKLKYNKLCQKCCMPITLPCHMHSRVQTCSVFLYVLLRLLAWLALVFWGYGCWLCSLHHARLTNVVWANSFVCFFFTKLWFGDRLLKQETMIEFMCYVPQREREPWVLSVPRAHLGRRVSVSDFEGWWVKLPGPPLTVREKIESA